MRRHWFIHIRRLLIGLGLCWLIGLWLGQPAWALVAVLLLYLVWHLAQVIRLHRWLFNSERPQEPPESQGLWGELFDGIYQLQARHRRSQERLQHLVSRIQQSANALQDAVIMTDSRGVLDWWNQAAERLLGFKSPTDRGQPIHNLVRSPQFKRYFMSKRYNEPLQLRSPHKEHLILSVQITLFGEDDRLILVRDMTRLHHLESMRRDFISNVSHELRTPLTVIGGYLETMQDHAADLAPRWQRAIRQMSQQSQRMQALVSDLLLLSKLEAHDQTGEQEWLDLAPMLESIRQDAQVLSGEQRHRIRLELLSHGGFVGDASQLRSAFSNIVFNAVKYTPAGGDIQIRWWADDGGAHLQVRDNGIGIDPIHIPRLTERFYRADPSRDASTGGTGLGLAIVKHVLINHEGRLDIESHPGQGSSFTCHFPLSRHQPRDRHRQA